jgi:HEAT repeat protein
MVNPINFQPYLDTIVNPQQDQTCRDWQDFYTPTEAELPLKVQTRSLSGVEEQRRSLSSQAKNSEQMEVLSGLRKYASQHVLLVGKPGSGKSTALKRLLWEEAKQYLATKNQKSQEELHVPVLIKLRECRNCSILDLIQKSLRKLRLNREEIEELLLDQQLLLLFDGLNEMPSNNVGQEVESFRSDFSDTPMIFTTRDLGVETSLGIQTKLELMPLTESQIHHFIEKRLPGQAHVLLGQIRDRLRELAETPLLLQMLCDVFTEEGQIPQNRGELFRKEIARRYAEFKPACTLPIAENSRRFTPELLQYLAFVMVQGNPHTNPCKPTPPCLTYVKTEAEKVLESLLIGRVTAPAEAAKEWLEDLLEHNLLQLADNPDEIEFHHQLFQEYYAAEYLLQQLPALIQKQPDEEYSRLQREYLNYLKWTEPIALMLALVDNETQAVHVVKLALDVDYMLGARLAGEVKQDFQEQTVQLVDQLTVPAWFKMELLSQTQSTASISRLQNALNDANCDVRSRAAEALGNIGSDAAIPALVQALNDANCDVRSRAAEALGNIGSNVAIPALVKALGYHDCVDQDCSVRYMAVYALDMLGSDMAIPGLMSVLGCPSIGSSAAKALGRLGSDAAFLALVPALNHKNSYVRRHAAKALGNIGSDAATPALVQALNDAVFVVRSGAAEALGALGSDAALPALVQTLNDEDSHVCSRAAEALGNISSNAAIPALVQALNHENSGVRHSVAEALGNIGSDAAIPALVQTLNDEASHVRRIAAKALGNIGSDTALPALVQALYDADYDVRHSAAEALSKLGSDVAIPALVKALYDENSGVRHSAVYALGKLGSDAATPALMQALNHEDCDVRRIAANALGNIGSDAALPALVQALNHKNSYVRDNAAKALGNIDSDAALPALVQALNHEDVFVRRHAAKALGNIGSDAAIPALVQALNDKNSGVGSFAAAALGKFEQDKAAFVLPRLIPLISTQLGWAAIQAMIDIQAQCKFYNYEIAQSCPPLVVQSSISS